MKTFRRPDVGHIQFKWVLDDPKTYTRPIGNDRVFVLTPNVELMEYSCMEGNLQSLLSGAITPWLEAKESDENLVYGEARDWGAYDRTKPQKLSGVIKTARYNRDNYGSMTIDSGGRTLTVILAPPVRMDFRGLTEDMLKPGVSVAVEGFQSRQTRNEVRAETITIDKRTFDLR